MDTKTETVATYNRSAAALAEKFDVIGARTADINVMFAGIGKVHPRVLEIGCGNGRDAVEILKRTNQYLGIDISEELIKLARVKAPRGKFEVADVETYVFPEGLDIVCAFASLIHTPKDVLKEVFARIARSLNENGILRISMKMGDVYREVTSKDEFGIRTYYLYSPKDIVEITPDFSFLLYDTVQKGDQWWLEIMLVKRV